MRLRLFVKMLVSILLKLCDNAVMRLLVRVLRSWQLHNAGNNQWLPMPMPDCSNQIPIHLPDELEGYLLGTYRFTFAMIRAAAKEFISHGDHHAQGPLVTLRLALRERIQMSYFGRGEKHGGCIRAGRDAGSAANACGCVNGSVCIFFLNQDRIGVRSASGWRADEASRLNDSVKSGPIHDQVANDWKGTGPPRLERQRFAIFEKPHRKLAHGCPKLAAMGHAVDEETARAADTFAAIVFEGDRRLLPVDQVLVESIKHFEERHIGCDILRLIADKAARCVCALLPPNSECEIHGYL